MINFHRPILAASLLPPDSDHSDNAILEAMKKLRYPVWATLKKDGIRAIRTSDLFSRTLHLIPNISIRYRSMKLPPGFDMELWNSKLQYDEVESIVMSAEHERSHLIEFHVLDWFDIHRLYLMRCNRIRNTIPCEWADVVFQFPERCDMPIELFDFFKRVEYSQGEGVCFRLGNSPYKQGRSTLREQYLVKLSRYIRTEVTIIGFEEQLLNTNSEKRNAIGMMDRSSFKAGMVGKGTLGAFLVRDSDGLEFRVGTGVGLTDKKRLEIWQEQDKWLNKTITIKHKPHGQKIKLRSPIMVGLRSEIDI